MPAEFPTSPWTKSSDGLADMEKMIGYSWKQYDDTVSNMTEADHRWEHKEYGDVHYDTPWK